MVFWGSHWTQTSSQTSFSAFYEVSLFGSCHRDGALRFSRCLYKSIGAGLFLQNKANKYSPTLLNAISLATRSEDNEKDEINPVVNIKRMKNDQMNVSYHFARLVGLTVDISFVKDTMHLSTNHPDQEKAEKWWKVTDGLIDINYLLAVLPELDLNEKYSQEIYFSYFIANPLSRFSSSTGNYKIYQVRPLFSKVDITYVDKEKVEIEGQKVKTHHLQLNFQNDVYAQPIFPAIRDGGVMEVWLTTDQSQVPVKLSTDREFWYNYSIE